MNAINRLYEAAQRGTLEDVQAAFGACSADELKEAGRLALQCATRNIGPCALEIMEFLIVRGAKPDSLTILQYAASNTGPDAFNVFKFLVKLGIKADSGTLLYAVRNTGPHALEIVEYLMGRGVEPNSDTLKYVAQNTGPCALKIMQILMERGRRYPHGSGGGVEPNSDTLKYVAQNTGPDALAMVKLLLEQGLEADSNALGKAAVNPSPDALEMVKLLMERGLDPHEKDSDGKTAFIYVLYYGNLAVADYLLSRDDFLLSDFMPRVRNLSPDIYKTYRTKAIERVSKIVDKNGIQYAKAVAADIEKILNTGPTKEDVKALGSIAKKISSMDRVNDARVSSSDFDCGLDDMER